MRTSAAPPYPGAPLSFSYMSATFAIKKLGVEKALYEVEVREEDEISGNGDSLGFLWSCSHLWLKRSWRVRNPASNGAYFLKRRKLLHREPNLGFPTWCRKDFAKDFMVVK